MAESIGGRQALRAPGLLIVSLGLVVIPALIWWDSIGDFTIYIEYETPPGQVCYILSKLAGLYAVLLLWLQVMLALIKGTPLADKLPLWSRQFHRNWGIATLAFMLLHVALFVAAASIRQAHFAYGVLIPNFSDGFYTFAVTLGVLALYCAIIVVIAGYLRTRKVKGTKWLHRVSFLVLSLALMHCLLIGTETRSLVMITVYTLMICAVLLALYLRISSARTGATQGY